MKNLFRFLNHNKCNIFTSLNSLSDLIVPFYLLLLLFIINNMFILKLREKNKQNYEKIKRNDLLMNSSTLIRNKGSNNQQNESSKSKNC